MKLRRLFVIAVLVATPAMAGVIGDYRAVQSVSVGGGSLQVLEDARLTPALARKLWKTAVDPIFVLGEDNPAARPFKAKPLVPARLRQITAKGDIAVDVVPDEQAPLARIETRRLGSTSLPVYLITTDNDAGFGSYSGRATTLYAVRDGVLKAVLATGDNGKAEPVALVSTLKSGWRIVDARPSHTVIEQILCRPDFRHGQTDQNPQFLVSYLTYWSDGHAWRIAKRVISGFWEGDEDWPATSQFPKPAA